MTVDPEHIACWQRLDARTTTSGRLTAPDVGALAALGVRHVINLALDDSPGALAREARLIAAAGMGYSHIPVPFEAPEEAHYRAFCTAFDAENAPIHVHCIMNWRVSAFIYRRNRERGMAKAQARAMLERQWSPETNDDPRAAAWAAFVARGDG